MSNSLVVPIEWNDSGYPPDEQREELELLVRNDYSSLRIQHPQALVFHHVPVTEAGLNGPLVFVSGKPSSVALHCRYDAAPKWHILDGAHFEDSP